LGAFLRKYYKVIILGLFLGATVFFFYSCFGHLLPRPKKITRIGLVGRYTSADLPKEILDKVSRGLVKINLDGSLSPDLAEGWEIKDERKLYIFNLRKGLLWNDGTALKASDLHFELKNVNVKVDDEFVLKFELKEPFSPFLALLSQPLFKKGFLGIGQYKVTSFKTSGEFIQSLRLENSNTLIYKFYPTEKAAILGFKLGEVDILENISDPSFFEDWPNIHLMPKICQDQFVAVFYNTKDPKLANKTLRQALTYAIEKPLDKSRAIGPFNPNSWAYNNQIKLYQYDLEKAKALLKESKIEKGEFELTTTYSQLSFAEKIKKSWEDIGIKTIVKVVSAFPEDFQVFLASQEIPPDPDQYTLWHSTQGTNITGYNDPKIDKLLEDGRKVLDQEERKAKYLDFQRFLVEDVPAAFLFHPTVYTVSRKG